MEQYSFCKIAEIRNGFSEKFGIPRQSGLTQAESVIIFEPEYRNVDALRGIEQYSHLWLIWIFSEFDREGWSPTVRPPRLGGNKRMGVFATRSPNRPNPIGLTVVEVVGVEYSTFEGPKIIVKGADLMNGTPILDIKPYVPYADARSEARGGFAHEHLEEALRVEISDKLLQKITPKDRDVILELLSGDPRPAYQSDETRVYSMNYNTAKIQFTVKQDVLTVINVSESDK